MTRYLWASLVVSTSLIVTWGVAAAQERERPRSPATQPSNRTERQPQAGGTRAPATGGQRAPGGAQQRPQGGGAPFLVRREPIYDHRPGMNGIVGYVEVWSDGSRRTVGAGGGAANGGSTRQPGTGGQRRPTIPTPQAEFVDLRSALTEQEKYLDSMREQTEQEDREVMSDRKQKVQDFYDLKEKEREARSNAQARTEEMVADARQQWDISNFRCSDGNPWDQCINHPDEKNAWLANGRDAVAQAQREGAALMQQDVDAVVQEGQKVRQEIQALDRRRTNLRQNKAKYDQLTRKQEAGEIWLMPGSKPPVYYPKASPTPRVPFMGR